MLRAVLCVAVLVTALLQPCRASGASTACEMCRMEREPASFKFPEGVNSCAEFYPSPECPRVDTDDPASTPVFGPSDQCHVNVYDQDCPFIERVFGTSTVHSSKNGGNAFLTSWVPPILVLIFTMGIFIIMVCVLRGRSISAQNTMYMTNKTYNINNV